MTVTAVDAELAGVMPMAERDRLHRRMDARRRHPVGSGEADCEHDAACRKRHEADQEEAYPGIRGRRKDLCHESGIDGLPRGLNLISADRFRGGAEHFSQREGTARHGCGSLQGRVCQEPEWLPRRIRTITSGRMPIRV